MNISKSTINKNKYKGTSNNIELNSKELMVSFENLFSNLSYLIQRGKGYSIYDIDDSIFENMMHVLKNVFISNYDIIKVSTIKDSNSIKINFDRPIIIYQDLGRENLLKNIDILVNKLIYPAWYNSCSIIFLSSISKKEYYVGNIDSSLIHSRYSYVLSLLALEQLDNLLELVNPNVVSPERLITYDEDVLYTPIEKILKDKFLERNIEFAPQVRLGRFYVDFIVDINHTKVIVECDGRDYHDLTKDKNRDKELMKEGYKIYRFSGSRIFNDCNKCVDEIILYTGKSTVSKIKLEDLNSEQRSAAIHMSGPIRVLAPAGSGKTKTLVNRIVNLVNEGVNETEILALAFNKKAEKEMSKRLEEQFNLGNVAVKTFHAFGNDLIKKTLKWNFNGDTQEKVTRSLLEKSVKAFEKINYQRNKDPLDAYLDMLSKTKNELLSKSGMLVEENGRAVNFAPIFNDYLSRIINNNFYNYDDMIYIALRRLLSDSSLRNKVQNHYKYILVDEFQDLNRAQLLLLQILILPENNVFICGDDDQMIYSFRGAEVRNILEFNSRYAVTSDKILKYNYRSGYNIVRHSKWLIDHNKVRVYKEITPFSSDKGNIELFVGDSLKDQADKIASWILSLKNDNTKWSDFAIVYRYNQYVDLLYIVLSQYNIPVPFDGIKILGSRVGRCVMSYFNILYKRETSNPSDYENILKRPNKYFTNEFISTISSWEKFINIDEAKLILRTMDSDRYINFVNKFKSLDISKKTPGETLNIIAEDFGLREFFKDSTKISSDIDVASDTDVLEIIIGFSEGFKTADEFYNFWISLEKLNTPNSSCEDEEIIDTVSLTSIHKTKGNEYKHVAYFNLVRSITMKATETEMEEERRVAYVGITRAKDHLIITTENNEFSPFISEIFLNPEYSNLSVDVLEYKVNELIITLNIIQTNIEQIKCDIEELTKKYPELKGIINDIEGPLKTIKRAIRKMFLKTGIKTFRMYNNKHTELLNELKDLQFKKII